MRTSLLPATAALLLSLVLPITPALAADVTGEFAGNGQILVLNSTDLTTASPADRIGCLDAHGHLALDACAVFTKRDDERLELANAAGNCTFGDPAAPKNVDSVYGQNTHAWSCGNLTIDGSTEYYYTIDGLNYPFICTMDIDCYFDIYAQVPTNNTVTFPVWQFFWGSQQFDVPTGHWRVLWLWVPVNSTSSK